MNRKNQTKEQIFLKIPKRIKNPKTIPKFSYFSNLVQNNVRNRNRKAKVRPKYQNQQIIITTTQRSVRS